MLQKTFQFFSKTRRKSCIRSCRGVSNFENDAGGKHKQRCSLGSDFRRKVKLRARTYRPRLGSFAMSDANSLAEEGNGPVGPLSPSHSRIWQRASRVLRTRHTHFDALEYIRSRTEIVIPRASSNAVVVNLNVICI